MFGISSYQEILKISSVLYLNFATCVAGDLSVTLSLIWLLVKSRTGFRRTDNVIDTIMLYTVNTAFIVGIDSAISAITYLIMPSNFIFMAFYLLTSKLYLNAYLAMLNARDDMRKTIHEPASLQLSSISDGTTAIQSEKGIRTKGVSVRVDTYTERNEDRLYTASAGSTVIPLVSLPDLTDSSKSQNYKWKG